MKCTLILLCILLLSACSTAPAAPGQEAGAAVVVKVTGVPVTRQAIAAEISLPGRLEPFHTTRLGARVVGTLKTLHVDLGDAFKRGDILAELAVPDLERERELARAQHNEKKASVTVAMEAVKLADIRHSRLKKVAKGGKGLVPAQRLDESKAAAALARARLGEARAASKAAEVMVELVGTRLDFSKVAAPYDGVVTQRFVDPGAVLQPGDEILEVAETARVRAVAYVPGADAVGLEPGVSLELVFPGTALKPVQATLTRVSGALDPENQTIRVEAHLDLPPGLKAGSYVRVNLPLKSRANALVAPARAFHIAGKPDQVYVVRDGKCVRATVATGADQGEFVEVLSGLREGEPVVVATEGTLSDGRPCRTGD